MLVSNDGFSFRDTKPRGPGKKGWIGIPTIALDALLRKQKVNPTLYVYEMGNFLYLNLIYGRIQSDKSGKG